jgi:hypothetical protein
MTVDQKVKIVASPKIPTAASASKHKAGGGNVEICQLSASPSITALPSSSLSDAVDTDSSFSPLSLSLSCSVDQKLDFAKKAEAKIPKVLTTHHINTSTHHNQPTELQSLTLPSPISVSPLSLPSIRHRPLKPSTRPEVATSRSVSPTLHSTSTQPQPCTLCGQPLIDMTCPALCVFAVLSRPEGQDRC